MPIYQLDDDIWFPPHGASEIDILAVGGDLKAERLITAYASGIFPWYDEPGEIYWWSPHARCILFTQELRVSKSMRNVLNRRDFRVTMDTSFNAVVEGCRSGERVNNTWIHNEVVAAYKELFALGLAHSVEVWRDNKLIGGLYGVSLGHAFFGESMFTTENNASKIALIYLSRWMKEMGWKLIDCQVYNDHLGSLGAKNIPREDFLSLLEIELKYPTLKGPWKF